MFVEGTKVMSFLPRFSSVWFLDPDFYCLVWRQEKKTNVRRDSAARVLRIIVEIIGKKLWS